MMMKIAGVFKSSVSHVCVTLSVTFFWRTKNVTQDYKMTTILTALNL